MRGTASAPGVRLFMNKKLGSNLRGARFDQDLIAALGRRSCVARHTRLAKTHAGEGRLAKGQIPVEEGADKIGILVAAVTGHAKLVGKGRRRVSWLARNDQGREGSFGTVWSARDRERVRRREQVVKVAVKIVDHGGEDTELVQNETEMHEKLFADGGGSPLLVKLYDVLFEDLRALLVLELFEGGELREKIDAAPQGRLPESVAAPIVRQLASALSFMHSKHVAHLDVKPENILVDSRPRIKLLDYGSACAMDQPNAPKGRRGLCQDIGGTDRYMAPERLALPSPSTWFSGAAADIYSLGAVLLHTLLGGAAADALAAKAAAMAKSEEANAKARANTKERPSDTNRQVAVVMGKAAKSAAAAAGSAAVQAEATRLEAQVRLSPSAMDLLLASTRVEPDERPAAAELLTQEWLLTPTERTAKESKRCNDAAGSPGKISVAGLKKALPVAEIS